MQHAGGSLKPVEPVITALSYSLSHGCPLWQTTPVPPRYWGDVCPARYF